MNFTFILLLGVTLSSISPGGKGEAVSKNEGQEIFSHSDFEVEGDLGSFKLSMETEEIESGLSIVTVTISSPESATPPKFSLKWKTPSVDIQALWTPQITLDKATYYVDFTSRAARYAPVVSLLSGSDENRMTFTCSDGLRSVGLRSYLKEEDAEFHNSITFFDWDALL